MSEILSNIVVEQTSINFSPNNNNINITPEPTALNIFTGGLAVPGGSFGELQYNNGTLAGIPFATYLSGNLSLGNISNIKIAGGSNNFAIITDGNGNLSFGSTANANYANFAGTAYNVSGSNVSGSVANANSANYANYANFSGNANVANTANIANVANVANVAYSVSAANITGTVANSNYAAYAGNVTIASQPNITALGTLTALSVSGTSNLSGNLNFTGARANLGTVSNVKVTGGTNGYFLQTDGTGNLSWVAGGGSGNGTVGGSNTQVQFNDAGIFGGVAAFTFDKSSNVMTVGGNVNASNVTGTLVSSAVTSMPYGTEKVGIIGAQIGTYNFDLITNSIQYSNANAAANLTLNFRGNSTTTLSSILSTGDSVTGTYLITTGATAYGVTAVQVDGSAQTIRWAGNISTVYSNTISSYTFTVVKTSATPTYLVFGSVTKYG